MFAIEIIYYRNRLLVTRRGKYLLTDPRDRQRTLQSRILSRIKATNMALKQLIVPLNFLLRVIVCFNLDAFHPIIFEVPSEEEKGSHFGLSVAIRPKAASLGSTWVLQVGAPRGSVPGSRVHRQGAVYRCGMYGPCRVFAVDEGLRNSGGWGDEEFKEKKDSAWIGVAMDVEDFDSVEKSVVCGHRWINQKIKNPENIDITYLMTGACYLQDLNETFEFPIRRLLPLVNKEKIYTPKPYIVNLSTYHWGLGQAGISVKLTKHPPNLLIGAPGVTHWIGSVVRYDGINWDVTVGSFAKTDIARKSRYTYLGYSITFGRFYQDKELWYVAGAPRAANYLGQVVTFQFKDSSDDVRIRTTLTGATFGEYFGSSVATADVNGDEFDDLIVGAPLFSNKGPDEGKVYVYLGTGRGNYLLTAQVIQGRASHGRFGSSIASLGDLNQDGYGDVAVGAPYEDDNKGAVYIYQGFPKGLQTEHSQRISASGIHPHLRGFGVSMSSPVDIDGNKYSDIAVGSYLSGHVVLLRSRPVISLHPKIRTENGGLIDRKDSYFNVTICSRYTGSNAPEHVEILRIVDIDPVFGRGTLSPRISGHRKILRLRANQVVCEVLPIGLSVSGKSFSPIQISLRNEIAKCASGKGSTLLVKTKIPKEADIFSKTCPFGNRAETSKEIPFAGVCGPDLICQPVLHLSCNVPQFRTGFYTLGSTEFLVLSMEVENHGEPAHDAKIKIWSSLKLRRGASSSGSEQNFWFEIEEVLSDGYKTNFTFKIDLEALKPEKERLNLTAQIFSSNLRPQSKNLCKFSVKLLSDDLLDLYASSTVDSVYVTKSRDELLNVTHYYEVRKTGATPVKDAEFIVYIPSSRSSSVYLTFEVETSEWMHSSEDHLARGRWDVEGNCPPSNRTVFLNCSTSDVGCSIVRIFFQDGIPTGFSSYVKIIMSLNVTAIDLIRDEKDIVHLSTVGVLKYSKYLEKESKSLEKTASVSLYDEERETHVDAHVIALSILAGGFLFCIIVTALAKSNFFRRVKKEELEALKDADACFVYFTNLEPKQNS